MKITAYDLAERFVGIGEVPGMEDNATVLSMLRLDGAWPDHDEVPWCSAFVNYIAWLLRLPRSKSLMARSWLKVGRSIQIMDATPGFDIVILKQDPDDGVHGHVGFYAGREADARIDILGGNQADEVNVSSYPLSRVIGVRRLLVE